MLRLRQQLLYVQPCCVWLLLMRSMNSSSWQGVVRTYVAGKVLRKYERQDHSVAWNAVILLVQAGRYMLHNVCLRLCCWQVA